MAIDKEKSLQWRIRIGSVIRTNREKKNLTCEELGALIGVTRQTISKIENGRFSVGIDTLAVIADALGCEWQLANKK